MTVEQIHNHSRACCDLQCMGPTKGPYLESLLPSLVSAINTYHRRRPLERLIPPHKTELYKSSFFPPSTTILWNNLPENIQRSTSISETNKYHQKNDNSVPAYFYIGASHQQIIHTKLRLHISDLNQDLVNRHISNDPSCKCGAASETVEHYLLHCPLYTQVRDYTIQTLPPHYITIPVFLSGDPNLPSATTSAIFLKDKSKVWGDF